MNSLQSNAETAATGLSEQVEFYPTFARLHRRKPEWRIQIHGRVVKPRADNIRRRLLLQMIRRVLKATPEQLESAIFQQRVAGFLTVSKYRRKIRIRFADQQLKLKKRSKQSGHFLSTFRVSEHELSRSVNSVDRQHVNALGNGWWGFEGTTKHTAGWSQGSIQLIDRVGPSVISDIDDTLKWTHVSDRRELLANTFFLPFREVAGMASLYDNWLRQGAAFHYVSSSPWQLYRPLEKFFDQVGFPAGSFHLRSLRLRDPSVLQLFVGRRRSKKRAIRRILKSFPSRQFVFVGDIGEKDPEIYGAAARRHPNQVARICVRRIPEVGLDYSRLKRAFRDIPRDRWQVFESPDELSDLVPHAKFGWQVTRPSQYPH